MKKYIFLLGLFCIIISLATWIMDYYEIVYKCLYCQVERTVIGLLGISMILNYIKNIFFYLIINLIAFCGISAAANQQLLGMLHISEGGLAVAFEPPVYENAFLLSIAAMILIAIQITMLNLQRFPKLRDILKD